MPKSSSGGRSRRKTSTRSSGRKRASTSRGRRALKGVNAKERRQYEHIKESAQRSGRYGRRAKEVAARTVMKQHKRKGHKKGR